MGGVQQIKERMGEETRKRLGLRIQEILDEYKARGMEPRNQRDLAKRIGHTNHMRIHRIIKGEYIRGLNRTDYQMIAKGLGLCLERLLLEDVEAEQETLEQLLENRYKPEEALKLAEKLATLAIGTTEKCRAFNNLGKAYSLLDRHDEASCSFERALHYAKEMKDWPNETYSSVFANLCMEYYKLERYHEFLQSMEEMERTVTDEMVLARIYHMRGMYYAGQEPCREMANQWYLQAMELYDKRGEKRAVGRIYHNMAESCFHMGQFAEALSYHQKARIYLVDDNMEQQCRSDKDYAKTLYMMNQKKEALDLIEMRLQRLGDYHNYEMIAKLLLFYAELKQISEPVDQMFQMPIKLSRELQLHAADLKLRLFLRDKKEIIWYNLIRESSPIAEKKRFFEEVWF